MAITLDNNNLTSVRFNNDDVREITFNNSNVFKKRLLKFNFVGVDRAQQSDYPVYIKSDSIETVEMSGASNTYEIWIPEGERVTIDLSKYKSFYNDYPPYGSDYDTDYECYIEGTNVSYGFRNNALTKITFTMDKDLLFEPYSDTIEYFHDAMGVLNLYTYTYEGVPSRSTFAIFMAEVKSNGVATTLTNVSYS